MKKTALTALFAALVLSLTVGMAACKKDCAEHVDEDTDLVCDVCGETVTAEETTEEETTEAPCVDHVDADLDEACDKCGEYVEYVPTEIGFEGLYNGSYTYEETEETIVYGQAEHLAALDNMYLYDTADDILTFRNDMADVGQTRLAFVSVHTGRVIKTLVQEDDEATVTYDAYTEHYYYGSYYDGESFLFVKSYENGRCTGITVYTSQGTEICKKDNVNYISVEPMADDLYEIDGKVYEIKDGVATHKYDKGLNSIPDVDYSGEKNYYAMGVDAVYVYDLDYKLVAYYAVPSDASSVSMFPLADGNVFVQYKKALPQDAVEYDLCEAGYYFGTDKYDVVQVIFNITDETVQAVELDYWVEAIVNGNTSSDLFKFKDYFKSDAFINVASVCPIVDKAIDSNHPEMANIRNDMFLLNYLADAVYAQSYIPEPLGNNRFLVSDESGKEYLVNEKGEMIGEVTEADYDYALKLFVMDGKYYDMDLKMVFDSNANTYDYVGGGMDYTLYQETDDEGKTTYYILNGITMKTLDLPENGYVNAYNNYFAYEYYVVEDEWTYHYYTSYYNAKGELIYTCDHSTQIVGVSYAGDVLVLRVKVYDYETYTDHINYYIAK